MSSRAPVELPDPERRGGPAWMARHGGCLSRCDQLYGTAVAAAQQLVSLGHRFLPFLARRVDVATMPRVPDSRLVRLGEEAALEQSHELRMHGFRSALFARALAHGDGVPVDPELIHLCGLLHDVGLMRAVTGEDFTLRSGAVAKRVCDAAGEAAEVGRAVEDALVVHTTVGIDAAKDGALGAYTQFGAMVDLTGLRLGALPAAFVRRTLEEYPRGAFKRELLGRFDAEVRAMPGGRFAFADRVGFRRAVEVAPFPS